MYQKFFFNNLIFDSEGCLSPVKHLPVADLV